MSKAVKGKLWNKNFTILFIANIVAMIGFQMINPNMAAYATSLGAKESTLGTITDVFALAALVARPFSGKAADRLDNKTMIFVSLLCITASQIVYVVANNMSILLPVRFLHGLFFGLNSTLVMTMASRALPEDRMGSGMGIFSLGQVISFSLGPYIGIYIAKNLGYNRLFIFAAVFSSIAAVLILFTTKIRIVENGETNGKEPFWKTFFAPEAIGPCTIALLTSTTFGAINTFLVLHADDRGVADIGMFFMVNAVTTFLCRPLVSRYIDRVSMKWILYPSIICLIGSMATIGLANSLVLFLLGAVLFGIGNAGGQPAMQAMSLKSVGVDRRGAASGTYYIGLDLGNTVGPIMASLVSGQFGYGNAFLSMMIPLALSLVVTFFIDRK